MSKIFSPIRLAFVSFLVLLQLFLLPAVQLLHVGCGHDHAHHSAIPADAVDSGEAAGNGCSTSHCCQHCSTKQHSGQPPHTEDQPCHSGPVHPPHDDSSCAICKVVFAARIGPAADVHLVATEPLRESITIDSRSADMTPRYCVFSRGPPITDVA
ncbi:MAG: hypothetical protein ABJZ55_01035 [Fuerstiella sp.]